MRRRFLPPLRAPRRAAGSERPHLWTPDPRPRVVPGVAHVRRAGGYSLVKGGDGRPGAITPSTSPSVLCHLICSEARIDRFALERQDAEHALVDAPERLSADKAFHGFDAQSQFTNG